MVETTNDTTTLALDPKNKDKTDSKQTLSQKVFDDTRKLYEDAHKIADPVKNIADGGTDRLANYNYVSLSSDKGVQDPNKVLTLDFNPQLKGLPRGNVAADGSIGFDAGSAVKDAVKLADKAVTPEVKKDASGNVVEVDYANGQSRKFGYDDKGKINQITDVDGRVAKLDDKTGKWEWQKTTGGGSGGAHGSPGGDHSPAPPPPDGSKSKGGESGLGGMMGGIMSAAAPDYVNPKVSADGTFSYSTSDGKNKEFNPDGSGTVSNTKDNSTVKTDSAGHVSEVDYGNGTKRQFEYTSDGSGVSHLTKFTDTDGKSYNQKDGKWVNADGSASGLTDVSVTRDGQFKETSKEGQSTTFATDLSRTVENPNHSVLKEDANGRINEIKYENGKTVTFGYDDCTKDPNKITGTDGKTITKGTDGKWKDESGNDTGIKDVRLQADGSYTYVDQGNHLVMNDTDGKPKTTTETIDQIKQHAKDIHDAENNKFLWLFNNPDGGKVNDIIKNMSPTDRYVLEQQYQDMYGKKLTDDISSNLDKKDAAHANELLYVANLQEDAAKYIPDAPGSDGKSQRQAFMDNMNTFLDRAHQKGMSDEEIASTFAATQRLLEAQDGKVSEQLRQQLAQQIMAESAHPEQTDQGQHLTCNVTDIETRTWFNHPSVMANMVADVALNGSYTASDGKQITIPPQNLIPDGEAVDNPPRDGARSFASQLAQAAMCNDIGQRENPPKYYTQLAPSKDASSGEFWTDASGKPLINQDGDNKGKPMAFSGIGYVDIAKECKRLTDEDHTTFLHRNYGGADELVGFKDENDLKDKINQAKKDGKMPIIIDVTADDPLFGGKYPSGDRSLGPDGKPNRHGADHVVCIDDYNPDTGMVHLDNSWGSNSDKWVPLHDLYQATT